MLHEHEIRARLTEYISGAISLASFERWLNRAALPLRIEGDDRAFRLAAKIKLVVSEYHDNVIGAQEFREELMSLLDVVYLRIAIDLSLSFAPPDVLSSNSSPAEPIALYV